MTAAQGTKPRAWPPVTHPLGLWMCAQSGHMDLPTFTAHLRLSLRAVGDPSVLRDAEWAESVCHIHLANYSNSYCGQKVPACTICPVFFSVRGRGS